MEVMNKDLWVFIETSEEDEELLTPEMFEEFEGEEVIKTTLPFDFFEEDNSLEFVEAEPEEEPADITEFNENLSLASDDDGVDAVEESTVSEEEGESEIEAEEEAEAVAADIPISRGFSVNTESLSDEFEDVSSSGVEERKLNFDSFGTIDDDDDDENFEDEPKKKFGIFRRKK